MTDYATRRKKPICRVLCVDDEPQVLKGLTLQLRRRFEVETALSGAEGLEKLGQGDPFGVVISDMRMPKMNGAEFLAQARSLAPDSVRILLTGHADIDSAIAAINEGQIFRFLLKPCPGPKLGQAIMAAARQYRLALAEKELLEQTLHGSIEALMNILALTHPAAFGRASRIKARVKKLIDVLNLEERWHVEVAAMVSQLGCVILSEETAKRFYFGKPLSEQEREQVKRIPHVAQDLLGGIPRLDPVLELLQPLPEGQEGSTEQQILRIASDYDSLESTQIQTSAALQILGERAPPYRRDILEALAALLNAELLDGEVHELSIRDLSPGMVFAEDVETTKGLLLVTRGYEVTKSFVERAKSFPQNYVSGLVKVVIREEISDSENVA